MDLQPEINNERGQLEWQWLCGKVGEHKARAAIVDLPGHRRPYPLNLIKHLGLNCPATLPVQHVIRL
jgi:hypothetical protein